MEKPPFTITNAMMNKTITIAEKLGRITSYASLRRMPTLRKNNRIKSIHSSLVIEANSLSLDQVRDVIDGKQVIGPFIEIQEVKNAFKAYNMIEEYDAFSELDLLKAHRILMDNIIGDAGKYRNHGEAVYDGDRVIFMAPPERLVPSLMSNLFDWLNNEKDTHILIKSCVFHYEFVFIHPFSDGNGRTARLWQNVLLIKWNPIFENIPIESQIQKYQNEYYETISRCHQNGNSNEFIEFMLKMMDEVIDSVIDSLKKESINISEQVTRLLEVMDKDIPVSASELMKRLKIKSRDTLRNSYLKPAIENGLVRMLLPDSPNSKNQKYVK